MNFEVRSVLCGCSHQVASSQHNVSVRGSLGRAWERRVNAFVSSFLFSFLFLQCATFSPSFIFSSLVGWWLLSVSQTGTAGQLRHLRFEHMTLSKNFQQVVGALQSCTTLKASKMPLVSHLNSWYKSFREFSRLTYCKWLHASKARRYGGCARRDTHPGQWPDSMYLHSEDRAGR